MSSCDVCLNVDGAGSVQFFYEEQRRARKQHKCYECRKPIEPGQRYWRVGGKCEGEMWRASICLPCMEINRVFSCGGYMEFGNLWENMREAVIPELTVRNDCFRKLSTEAKAVLTAHWWEWKERYA